MHSFRLPFGPAGNFSLSGRAPRYEGALERLAPQRVWMLPVQGFR